MSMASPSRLPEPNSPSGVPPGVPLATAALGAAGELRASQGAAGDLTYEDAIRKEPLSVMALRRFFTYPGLVFATVIWLGLGAIIVPVGFVVDLARRKPQLLVRFWAMLATVMVGQLGGVIAIHLGRIACALGLTASPFRRVSNLIMARWSNLNVRAMAWIYGMRIEVEGGAQARGKPTLLLSRHSSIIDTILPMAILGNDHGIAFRIVLKHELLYSPPADAIGHYRPTAFVRRGAGELTHELEQIRRLGADLGADESVLIFPEGTRFTPAKKAQVIAKLAAKNPQAAAEAAALHHVLPIRPAGTHALIEGAPGADLLFCAHTGFEEANQLEDFVGGSLYRKHVKIKYWRVPAADIPADRASREAFLARHWRAVDVWVAANADGARPTN